MQRSRDERAESTAALMADVEAYLMRICQELIGEQQHAPCTCRKSVFECQDGPVMDGPSAHDGMAWYALIYQACCNDVVRSHACYVQLARIVLRALKMCMLTPLQLWCHDCTAADDCCSSNRDNSSNTDGPYNSRSTSEEQEEDACSRAELKHTSTAESSTSHARDHHRLLHGFYRCCRAFVPFRAAVVSCFGYLDQDYTRRFAMESVAMLCVRAFHVMVYTPLWPHVFSAIARARNEHRSCAWSRWTSNRMYDKPEQGSVDGLFGVNKHDCVRCWMTYSLGFVEDVLRTLYRYDGGDRVAAKAMSCTNANTKTAAALASSSAALIRAACEGSMVALPTLRDVQEGLKLRTRATGEVVELGSLLSEPARPTMTANTGRSSSSGGSGGNPYVLSTIDETAVGECMMHAYGDDYVNMTVAYYADAVAARLGAHVSQSSDDATNHSSCSRRGCSTHDDSVDEKDGSREVLVSSAPRERSTGSDMYAKSALFGYVMWVYEALRFEQQFVADAHLCAALSRSVHRALMQTLVWRVHRRLLLDPRAGWAVLLRAWSSAKTEGDGLSCQDCVCHDKTQRCASDSTAAATAREEASGALASTVQSMRRYVGLFIGAEKDCVRTLLATITTESILQEAAPLLRHYLVHRRKTHAHGVCSATPSTSRVDGGASHNRCRSTSAEHEATGLSIGRASHGDLSARHGVRKSRDACGESYADEANGGGACYLSSRIGADEDEKRSPSSTAEAPAVECPSRTLVLQLVALLTRYHGLMECLLRPPFLPGCAPIDPVGRAMYDALALAAAMMVNPRRWRDSGAASLRQLCVQSPAEQRDVPPTSARVVWAQAQGAHDTLRSENAPPSDALDLSGVLARFAASLVQMCCEDGPTQIVAHRTPSRVWSGSFLSSSWVRQFVQLAAQLEDVDVFVTLVQRDLARRLLQSFTSTTTVTAAAAAAAAAALAYLPTPNSDGVLDTTGRGQTATDTRSGTRQCDAVSLAPLADVFLDTLERLVGPSATRSLRGMLRDVRLSHEVTRATPAPDSAPVVAALILNSPQWPWRMLTSQDSRAVRDEASSMWLRWQTPSMWLHPSWRAGCARLSAHYRRRHPSRVLHWLPHASTALVVVQTSRPRADRDTGRGSRDGGGDPDLAGPCGSATAACPTASVRAGAVTRLVNVTAAHTLLALSELGGVSQAVGCDSGGADSLPCVHGRFISVQALAERLGTTVRWLRHETRALRWPPAGANSSSSPHASVSAAEEVCGAWLRWRRGVGEMEEWSLNADVVERGGRHPRGRTESSRRRSSSRSSTSNSACRHRLPECRSSGGASTCGDCSLCESDREGTLAMTGLSSLRSFQMERQSRGEMTTQHRQTRKESDTSAESRDGAEDEEIAMHVKGWWGGGAARTSCLSAAVVAVMKHHRELAVGSLVSCVMSRQSGVPSVTTREVKAVVEDLIDRSYMQRIDGADGSAVVRYIV